MTMQADVGAPLVVLEGIDGSGKGTQAALLHSRFKESGRPAQLLSFPRYQSTFFGHRIGEFLNGDFGTLDQLDPFLVSLLYAGDRFESRDTLHQARQGQDVVVLDRYVPSNIAHQSAKKSGEARVQLQQWIEQIEYGIYQMPRPDLVVLLDLPVEVSQQLILMKQRRSYTEQATDLQEADVDYLDHVRNVYLHLARSSPGWKIVSVTDGDRIRTIEEISEEIWGIVQERFDFTNPTSIT
ncbi:dTMP kinase [Planctomicrobium sp. SH661]|uniref:dTMP kinase n=1 Tax=Planctomicrobium sp. SH661 TaxID=3448124 RepID=UPI003F5BB961